MRQKLSVSKPSDFLGLADIPVRSYHGVGLWSAVEIDVAVTSACLPTIRPLLKSIFSSTLQKLQSMTGKNAEAGTISRKYHQKASTPKNHRDEFQRLPEYGMDRMKADKPGHRAV